MCLAYRLTLTRLNCRLQFICERINLPLTLAIKMQDISRQLSQIGQTSKFGAPVFKRETITGKILF